MEFSKDFDLNALIEEQKALIVKPQLRFLWQVADLLEEYKKKASDRFGVPFDWGYDGICFCLLRRYEPGWWKLTVTETYCRIDYTNEESLRQGLDFCLSHWCVAPDGRMFLPCGTWASKD